MLIGISGKNLKLSLEELKLLKAKNIWVDGFWIKFDAQSQLIFELWGFVKIAELVDLHSLKIKTKLLGSNDPKLVKKLKQEGKITRYKIIEPQHVDLEIKNKGIEILQTPFGYAQVVFYQPIEIYQTIDFDKPLRGMEVGMMPAKLTHIMVNIARAELPNPQDFTIYDPFVGFGTTAMITNWLGGKFIGSDINITMAKQNIKRWQSQPFFKDKPITLFKHDVTKPFTKKFLQNVDAVVSEWWLGPSLRWKRLDYQFVESLATKVGDVYKWFLSNWYQLVNSHQSNLKTMVISLPYWSKYDISLVDRLLPELKFLKWQKIDRYLRSKQRVGRELVKIHFEKQSWSN